MSLPFPADAVWIGSDHAFDLHEVYLRFRSPSTWYIDTLPKHTDLYITADSRYKLWVNGQFVARGPARCYPHMQSVDQLDITPYLQRGHNTLAVQVYQPGYSHFSYVHRGMAGMLAVVLGDNLPLLVTSDQWRTARDRSYSADVPPMSIYWSGVEVRDLSLAEDWTNPTFDDSAWATARRVAPLGGYPWDNMQLRAIPLLNEGEAPLRLVETRRGKSSANVDPHDALRETWSAASTYPLQADAEGWFTVSLSDDESACWLFDLGRGYSCQGWAEIRGANGSETLAISYTEKLLSDDVYLSDPRTYCRMRMTDTLRLRPGDQTAEGFALRGGRLILFQLSGSTDAKIRFYGRIAEYPLQVTRCLSSPDPVLSHIITMCENTLRACLLDGFIDNPWRESAQWIGDALPEALIMSVISADSRPLRRVIELAAQGAYPDGVLPGVVPSEAHAYTVLDFNFLWVELLHLYHQLEGDADFVEAHWSVLQKLLNRFWQDRNADGLLMSQIGRRLFLDWSAVSRQEPSAIYNLHFLFALRQAAELATRLGKMDDAAGWQAQAGTIQEAVRGAFWADGRWYDDKQRSTFSQQAAALAVLSGAADPNEIPALLDAITARSLDPDDNPQPDKMVLASPFAHHRILEALRLGGRSEVVLEIIRTRWGRWLEEPTTWENWKVDFPDGSCCHAFSAHPRYHLAHIAHPLLIEEALHSKGD
jgi:hypothetical protein